MENIIQNVKSSTESTDEKIIFLFVKISQLMNVFLWDAAKNKNLSPLQLKILLHLKESSEGFRKVSLMASEFSLTRATVSDAVRALIEKGFVRKKKDKEDGRSFILGLTESGKRLLERDLLSWNSTLKEEIGEFSAEDKEKVFLFLAELLMKFQEEGIIENLRMCFSCQYFTRNAFPESEKPHLCRLTGRKLADFEMNVRCESNEQRKI
ncbi:MAG: MarR family winged helix-turn-helix transcriptional regulator [Candidatus Aminicenantales bacterium]